MAKISKQMYYGANGDRKLNCYKISISKEVLKQTNIKEDDDVKVYAKDNKIIIEKES